MKRQHTFLKGMLCGVGLSVLAVLGGKAAAGELSLSLLTAEGDLDLNTGRIASKIRTIENLINESFYGDTDTETVEASIYRGMLDGLDDKYAAYYTAKERAKLTESLEGSYEGIGVTVTRDAETDAVTVVQVYEGTPAAEAGMQAGDVLTAVNGQDVSAMELESVVALIKTAEGDTVSLTLLRNGKEQVLNVARATVNVPTVEYKMLEDAVGYLKIQEFDTVTVEQFKEAKEALESEGMEKLIIDVRDNPGGTLDSVCDILREILPEGLMVYTQDKDGNREEYTCDGTKEITCPLAVLVNGYSASAAEVFSGAVKDYGIGVLVGTTTYGKGIVQRTWPLADGSAVKLTVAKYFTPLGNDIHGIGIEPDVEVEADAQSDTDNQLQAAIEALAEK